MIQIAVCDDEQKIVTTLENELSGILGGMELAHRIDAYLSGLELCRAMDSGSHYDLVFLDISFAEGEMDGVEAGQRIRKAHRENAVVIVYISWVERSASQLLPICAQNLLIKPLTRDTIQAAVETFLADTHLNRAGGLNLTHKILSKCYNSRIK